MAFTSVFLKEYLTNHQVKISYVRNKYGFKKGVVVYVDGKFGWSMVNKSEDYRPMRVRPDQVPVIQHMVRMGVPAENIFASNLWKGITSCPYMKVPMFEKTAGVMLAIEAAHRGSIMVQEDGSIDLSDDAPMDSDLADALSRLVFNVTTKKKDEATA